MPTVSLTNPRGDTVSVASLPELNHWLRLGYRPSGTVATAQQTFTGQPTEPPALDTSVGRKALLREASARRVSRPIYPTALTGPTINTTAANAITSAHTDPVYYPPANAAFSYRQGAVKASDRPQAGTRGNSYVQSDHTTAAGYFNAYAVEFWTTAATVEFGYLGTAFPQFRVWIDDKLCSLGASYPWATELGSGTPYSPSTSLIQMDGTGYHQDNADHMIRVATNGPRQMRKWRVECANGLNFGGVWIERVDALSRGPEARPRALVMGDSFTTGAGGDGQVTGFTSVLAWRMGWDVWSSGSGGTGYLKTNGAAPNLRPRLAADCYRFDPDIVVVAVGVNDDPPLTAAAIGTEAAAAYADIATNLPGVPVAVVLPWRDAPGSVTTQFEADRRAAIRAAAQAAPNVSVIVDPDGWITGTGNVNTPNGTGSADLLVGGDNLHVKQLGHEWLGTCLSEALAVAVV